MTVKVDVSQFNKTMKEYMKYTSRTYTEACNQHAYYIARNATQTTPAADKEVIRKTLMAQSKDYPAPLAAILVNWQRGKAGKKGLYGQKMAKAVESLIKKTQAHTNFLRSGWIPAIKKLKTVVQKKGGTPIPPGTDKKGRTYGGASAAKMSLTSLSPFALIWNSATGKGKNSKRSLDYIRKGAQKAINMEVASMVKYINKKKQEAAKKFWGIK